MRNLLELIKSDPITFRQLSVNEMLVTEFNCPVQQPIEDYWTDHNYFVYILEGKKIWHTSQGSFELNAGNCLFVRKGANILEREMGKELCVVIFFVTDDFIRENLSDRARSISHPGENFAPVIPIKADSTLSAFFQSVLPYFSRPQQPDQSLLELKFRELLLNVTENEANSELYSYFCSLVNEPGSVALKKIMEDNFCFNLKMEEYARLCNRSLSAFKRDFQKIYQTTPGKWLITKRLARAKMMIAHSQKSIGEIAFECGFENLSHFSRAFRLHFGIIPSSVRGEQVA